MVRQNLFVLAAGLFPVKSNENVTERQSFSQKIMLPGLSPPFFDFDDLDGAELKWS